MPDRILVGPLAARERVVHEDDARRVGVVVRGEEPALDQRHAQRTEIVVVDRLVLRLRLVTRSRPGTSLDEERSAPRRLEREEVAGAGDGHAGLSADGCQELIVEGGDLGEIRVRVRQLDLRRDRASRLETGILLDQTLEAARQQRRTDQQHDGQADLGHDQRAARSPSRAAAVAAAARLLQRPLHVAARHQHRRHDAEGDRGQQRQGDRKRQHARVEADAGQPRQLDRRRGDQRLDRSDGDGDAEHGPHDREQHALSEKLPNQAAAARADRRADGDLPLPHRRARQQQARDVGAGDDQQKRRRAEQREERRPEDADDLGRERNRTRGVVAVGGWIFNPEALRQRAQLVVRSLDGDTRFQPGDRLHEMGAAAVLGDVPRDAMPDVGPVRIRKPLRHHADDGEQRAVERDRLADNRRVAAETFAPQAMADHRDPVARVGGTLRETGAEHRLHAEHGEEVRRRLDRADPLRVVPRLGQRQLRIPPGRGIVEHLRQAAIVDEVDRRDPLVRQPLAVVGFPHHRQAIGIGIWKRAQHHAIEDAEDRGGRADPERQRQHRRDREPRRPPQQAPAEPDVLQQRVHGVPRPGC